MKRLIIRFYLFILALLGFTNLYSQNVDTNYSITIHVQSGQNIRLKLGSNTSNQFARIVSGNTDTLVDLNNHNFEHHQYFAAVDTMTIYGKVSYFGCDGNGNNLTLIDASHNSDLYYLICSYNNLSSMDLTGNTALVTLFCDYTNRTNLDLSRLTNLIEFSCRGNSLTSLDLSGLNNLENVYCDSNSISNLILGHLPNLVMLSCVNNSLTSLDLSGLSNLEILYCYNNSLTSLDLLGLSNLEMLYCFNNSLTSLDLTGLSNLIALICNLNSMENIVLNGLINLERFYCAENLLTNLNLSGLSNLREINCSNNQLTNLDLNGLINLDYVHIEDNNFSTSSLDSLYCSLEERQQNYEGLVFPLRDSSSSNYSIVMATNKQNALLKNWKIAFPDFTEIPPTTGTYNCNLGISEVNNSNISAKIYPNPLTKDLTIEADENIDRLDVLNVLGQRIYSKEVKKNNSTLDFSPMNKGVYIIKLFMPKGERAYRVIKE